MGSPAPAGRTAAVDRIAGWLDLAIDGRCVVGAVVGDAGVGKTMLLAAVRDLARDRGCTVLATQGREADAEIGFASLLTLLHPLEHELDELAGDAATDVRAALALGRHEADPVGVHLGVFRCLANLAARGPVLVVVDDAEHIDAATATALAFALGRLDADPVGALLASARPLSGPLAGLAFESLVLEPLDDDVLAGVVGERVELHPTVLDEVLRLASGNPLAALELAGSLSPQERSGSAPFPAVPRPTAAMLHGFESRLAEAPEAARRAVAVVAADDLGEVAVITAALAQLGEPATGLADAEAAGLIERDATRVRLAHPLLRAVAYHQVAPASRRAAHHALATALARPDQAAARAWQLAAAADGPDETAASALELVAEDVLRRGGPASATRTLERAAALSPRPEVAQRRLAQASLLWSGSDRSRARRVATEVGPPADADIASVLIESVGNAGPLEDEDPDGRFAALHAEQALAAGRLDEARAATEDCLRRADPAAAQLATAVLVAVGRCPDVEVELAPRGEGRFAAHAWRLARIERVAVGWLDDLPDHGRDPTAVLIRSRVHLQQGRVQAALDLLHPRVELDDDDQARLLLCHAELLLGRGSRVVPTITECAERLEAEGALRLAAEAWWLLGRATSKGEALQRAAMLSPGDYGADAVASLMASGRTDAARSLASELDPRPPGGPLRRARAWRAAATAGIDERGFDEALAVCDEHGLVVEALEVLHAQGRHADARARAQLTDVKLFEAPALTAGGRDDLRDRLSPAEMRVAEVIAAGLTNRQAAEALFLSIKTVDFHLQQIYRKLGIRTRTQLAVLVSRYAGADGGEA